MYRGLKFVRFAIPLLMAPLLLWSMRATVLAAPPTNDTFVGATPVTIGFREVIDTTEATTEPNDALLGPACGAPISDASVWYAFTTTEDTRVLVDTSGSDPLSLLRAPAMGCPILGLLRSFRTAASSKVVKPKRWQIPFHATTHSRGASVHSSNRQFN